MLRQRLARRLDHAPSRRVFLRLGLALFALGALVASQLRFVASGVAGLRGGAPIRPPSASHDDLAFQEACIRCGLCGTVCENGCIRFFGLHEPEHGALTPHLDVRRRSCTLCMRCTAICPTGALSKIEDDLETIGREVRMGLAVVDPGRCISYQGRICGYCHDACPLPGSAIRLVPKAKPLVVADGCVGCGRCVEACPQLPTAIDVRRIA
jgi:ferredoxin-type protein NapG